MSGIGQLPPQVQERLQRLQNLQNTLQQLLVQRQRIEMEMVESDKALETLNAVDSDKKVYKSVVIFLYFLQPALMVGISLKNTILSLFKIFP